MNELTLLQNIGLPEEYRAIWAVIDQHSEMVAKALTQHGKSHTQFQQVTVDMAGPTAGPTKLRNFRQILAVIQQTEIALQEAYFSLKEKQLDITGLEKNLKKVTDSLESDRIQLNINKKQSEIKNTKNYVAGAIRKLASYYQQYAHLEQQLKKELSKDQITEADFEADEERFAIMKAFEQALCAARARGGTIDEGNFIYLHDIGVNGAMAQNEITQYLEMEGIMINQGREPKHMHQQECAFLECMANKYAGCAVDYTTRKGLLTGPMPCVTLGHFEQT